MFIGLRESNINVREKHLSFAFHMHLLNAPPMIEPAAKVCALTGNGTHNLLGIEDNTPIN